MIFIIIVEMSNYHKYISEDEEIRDWFLVSSNRKKVRNIQLWLLEEVKKICKKHNIKYYANWGTLLWAIRHWWFIPWDDDLDLVMFRDEYEKFINIAKNELPSHIKFWDYYHDWFSKLVDTNTTALTLDNNWWDNDFSGWIRIDIFPLDYASKFKIVNKIKANIIYYLRYILHSKRQDNFRKNLSIRKKIFILPFLKIDCSKIYHLHEKITRKTLYKWNKIYTGRSPSIFYPASIFNDSHEVIFESIKINIPNWYDSYLKIAYWNYNEKIIYSWGHKCRYSTKIAYKDVIWLFDRFKKNIDNYNNCKGLFQL